jgi:hypothetical protein
MTPKTVIEQSHLIAHSLGLDSSKQNEMTARILRQAFPDWSESQVLWAVENAQNPRHDT